MFLFIVEFDGHYLEITELAALLIQAVHYRTSKECASTVVFVTSHIMHA
jgi:hypothetical protein